MKMVEIRYLFAMTMVLFLACAFGAYGLNIDIIWGDEIWSLAFMGAFDPPYSPAQIVATIQDLAPDHVPLFYLISAAWGQLVGWSPVVMRYLSLLFGVLMVAWLYRFTTDAVNRRTAMLASMMMTTTSFVIVYFHELRAYTFLMAFAIVHTWLYWRLTYRYSAKNRIWVAFILTTAVLLYTHNFSLALFAGLGISHLVYAPRSRQWIRTVIAWGLGALLFLPYLPALLFGDFAFGSSERADSTVEVLEAFATVLVNGYLVLWAPLLLAFGYLLWRDRNRAVIHLLLMTLVMCLVMFIVNQQFSLIAISRMRYFLILWWPIVILFAIGLVAVPRWKAVSIVAIVVWAAAGFLFGRSARILEYTGFIWSARNYPPMHSYSESLLGKTKTTDYLVGFTETSWVNYDRDTMSGYSALDYYLKVQLGIDGEFIDVASKNWEIRRDVARILDERPSLLFAHNPRQYERQTETAKSAILEQFSSCPELVDRSDLLIQRFVHTLMNCEHDPSPIEYKNGIRVLDYAARFDALSDRAQALIWWDLPDENELSEFNISLQIITPDWQKLRQIDRHLNQDTIPWHVLELSTDDFPAGEYRLMLVLYRRDTGERIQGLDLTSTEQEKILPLLSFIKGA